jgi:hypothetical protein
MTQCSRSMGRSWDSSAHGGVARKNGYSRGLMGVLLVVVIGEGKLVVPVDFVIRRPDPTGAGGPCRKKLHWCRSCWIGAWRPWVAMAYSYSLQFLSRIVGLAIRSSWTMWPQRTRASYWLKGRVRMCLHCQMDVRSRGVTYSISATGPGVTVHRFPAYAMRGCGPPVRRMVQ